MIRRRSRIGLALACALVVGALVAQGASAAGNGQTIFECSTSATTKEFSDAHCDNTGGSTFGHVQFPTTSTAITVTNGGTKNSTTEATVARLTISSLHGFSNVVIECTNVEGTGTAQNTAGPPMKGSGSGTIKFNNGTSGGVPLFCSTNQAGCAGGSTTVGAKVATVSAKAETVEGELEGAGKGNGMGLKFEPVSGNFTTITFEGTCGLHAFGAIPVTGSATATPGGIPQGRGATLWFIPGAMNSITLGGVAVQLEGKLTLKRTSTGNALTFTTS